MECAPRIVRERKVFKDGVGKLEAIQVYCPILGEIVLFGEEAEKVKARIEEAQGHQSPWT
ncbi:MAG: hypothetical protein HYY85_10785 [Deltaproteobacteria bacterium]|nr:hypothetical protein [Deltaproteobacteria bacterium]